MNRTLVALVGGAVTAAAVYLSFALPEYFYLRAHQPHWVVVDDPRPFHLALPQSPSHQHLESTVPDSTSFPPSFAFFAGIPCGLIAFVLATLAIWLGLFLVAKRRASPLCAQFLLATVVAALTGCATTPIVYHAGDTQEGRASWYGSENGRVTASGESYDPRAFTAAHRHLPFGSVVRVTDLQNGRSVDVRINDRGPWTDDGRIIDVSSAAADQLAMKKAGVVPVELEVLEVGSGKRADTGG